jgi:hypothetical protein
MEVCVYGLWHLGCVTAACAPGVHYVAMGTPKGLA